MENLFFKLLPLLGLLALIKRIRDNRYPKKEDLKSEEMREPSFEIPDPTEKIFRDEYSSKNRVWNELISLSRRNNWRYGIFESENYIDIHFSISENRVVPYRYYVSDEELHFNVCVLQDYPPESATGLFVLASHFNNLLNFGKVRIEVNDQNVYFTYQNELLLYDTFNEKINEHIGRHFHIANDVYSAFQKFINEGEEPAVIIGELIAQKKKEWEKPENNERA